MRTVIIIVVGLIVGALFLFAGRFLVIFGVPAAAAGLAWWRQV